MSANESLVDALARELQATSHKHTWKDCEFKSYFIAQAEALVERGVRVVTPDIDQDFGPTALGGRTGR